MCIIHGCKMAVTTNVPWLAQLFIDPEWQLVYTFCVLCVLSGACQGRLHF